jgi:uncharacterized protein with FMN-binding domain
MKAYRIIPALLAAAGTAIPLAAGAEIIMHADGGSSPASLAAAPATSTPAATATPTQSAAAPTSTPKAAPTATQAAPTPQPTTRTIQGSVVAYQFGTVQATVTLTGKKITDVTINVNNSDPRSQDINSQAVPYLRSETLQAQSANVNIVSGATLTSQAYAQSLQAALQQAGL